MKSPINSFGIQKCRNAGTQAIKQCHPGHRSGTKDYSLRPKDYRLGTVNVRRAFTLIELMIVVSILGIMAAIVLPELQGHTQLAKEATSKDSLRLFRTTIERYATDHNGVAPGYNNDNPDSVPTLFFFNQQLVANKTYLNNLPENPFNNKTTILIVNNANSIPESPTGIYGWIYKPATKSVKLDWTGLDSEGNTFYDY